MSSDVDICNLALAHLGDSATLASIDPPEGSAQADHCQRWYPIARNALLEMREWNFAITRVTLAELGNTSPHWEHAYARPSDCLKVLSIGSVDDANAGLGYYDSYLNSMLANLSRNGQQYVTETDPSTGAPIILTNQSRATARYTRVVTDTNSFSPLFTTTLARYLAHYLAGPVLKGETGIQVGQAQLQIAMQALSAASLSNASQSSRDHVQAYPWSR